MKNLITYLLIGIIAVSAIYVVTTKTGILDDFLDDIFNPDDVLYIEYNLEIHKGTVDQQWHAEITSIRAYFATPGDGDGGGIFTQGNAELKILGLLDRDYSIKFTRDALFGITSTHTLLLDTGIHNEDLTIGTTYHYNIKVYLDGNVIHTIPGTLTVQAGTGQIIVGVS